MLPGMGKNGWSERGMPCWRQDTRRPRRDSTCLGCFAVGEPLHGRPPPLESGISRRGRLAAVRQSAPPQRAPEPVRQTQSRRRSYCRSTRRSKLRLAAHRVRVRSKWYWPIALGFRSGGFRQRLAVRVDLADGCEDVIDAAAVGQQQRLGHPRDRLANQLVARQFLKAVAVRFQSCRAE